jgi:putative protease
MPMSPSRSAKPKKTAAKKSPKRKPATRSRAAAKKKPAAKPKPKPKAKAKAKAKTKTRTATKTRATKAPAKKTAAAKPRAKAAAGARRPAVKAARPAATRRRTAKPGAPVRPPQAAIPAPPVVPANELKIGVVTHYYSHLSVAVVSVTDRPLQVGDRIHVKGHTSDSYQTVESIQVEHESRPRAEVGQAVGLRVTDHAREHDVVYRVT